MLPILAGLTTNTLTKMVVAISTGGRRFALQIIPGLILVVLATWFGATSSLSVKLPIPLRDKVPILISLEQDDIKDLRNCRPDNCELQVPEESMESAQNTIDWNSPTLTQQVNDLAKHRIIELLDSYQHDGDRALGTYRDKRDPTPVAEHFQSVFSRVEFFPQYLPDLNRYLLEYPHFKPAGTQDFVYWEKVNFGLKPTIRVNHGVVYHPPGEGATSLRSRDQATLRHALLPDRN